MKTPYYSYKLGNLPDGCKLCVQGKKLVIFITGLCPRCCYFCPISDQKYKKDVIYADEWHVKNIHETIQEAKAINAKGAGITGGDPLCKLNRTVNYIKQLKKEFGKDFHIHLYTSLNLVNKKTLNQLYNAGLDEIRFHLDLESINLWNKVKLALGFDWDIGVEIPVVPKKTPQLKKIIMFINNLNQDNKKQVFLNLNELEVADNKVNKLLENGFRTRSEYSYAVKGSEQLALRLLKYIKEKQFKIHVHYCTATLKDKVQLANRIKRRAKNTKKPYDTLTNEGTFIRGAVYLEKPSFGYHKKLEGLTKKQKEDNLKELSKIKNKLQLKYKIEKELIDIDKTKFRILTKPSILRKFKEPYIKAIVEEYPTQDQLELNIEFLA